MTNVIIALQAGIKFIVFSLVACKVDQTAKNKFYPCDNT